MHTEIIGTGNRHIVLLHGWGHSLDSLRQLGSLLALRYRVHLIDLPGFGKSPAPESTWNSFDYADALAKYLKEQGIERACLCGHSFGGKVAFSFASRYPEQTDKLILIAASGLKPCRPFLPRLRTAALRVGAKLYKTIDALWGSKLFETEFIPRFGSADYKQAGSLRSILVQSVNEDLSAALKEVQCKTLLLWGGKDKESPLEIGKRMHALIRNSSLLVFPDKGHALPLDVGSQLCMRYIAPFLEEAAPC